MRDPKDWRWLILPALAGLVACAAVYRSLRPDPRPEETPASQPKRAAIPAQEPAPAPATPAVPPPTTRPPAPAELNLPPAEIQYKKKVHIHNLVQLVQASLARDNQDLVAAYSKLLRDEGKDAIPVLREERERASDSRLKRILTEIVDSAPK